MTTQLQVYNDALLLCGERFLSSLTEAVESRRLLDQVWGTSDGVKRCLEAGQWFFAMRSVRLDYDSSIEPDFGLQRAFEKPSDWCLTSAVCLDEFFITPALRYVDEAGYWYADVDQLFIRYVSDDELYGMNLLKWPQVFREYVAAMLASRIALKISASESVRDEIKKAEKAALLKAKSLSLMAGPTQFPARGSWVSARNRFPNRRDGGNSNSGGSLIG